MKTIPVIFSQLALLGRLAVGLTFDEPQGPVSKRAAACAESTFQDVLPDYASVLSVVQVTQGQAYGQSSDVGFPINATDLPDLCAVIVNVTSSPTSAYTFGMFLPAQWNSRFLEVGNSGFAGGINWLDMGNGVKYGFAVTSTDTGHNSTLFDLSWGLDQPEKRIDFGWRSIHGTCVLGKALVETFYGQNITYSYYAGASTGGRQGLKEIELYPDSFDGILIGAPAWWASHLQPWVTKITTYQLPATEPKNVDTAHILGVANAVIEQCDKLDGVEDGIVSYPDWCHLDYDAINCNKAGANASTCLTPVQIQTIKNIYSDWIADGRWAFPGYLPSSEAQWPVIIGSPTPNGFGLSYIQDFLFNDAEYPLSAFNDSVVWIADTEDPGNLSSTDYDLSPFRSHGGKIIMNHGLADGFVPTHSSIYFYEADVAAATADSNTTALQDWFKFYLVPGMQHIAGTAVNAPWYFASGDQAGFLGINVYSVPGYEDPQHDSMLALMAWVENGTEFDTIIATGYKNQTDPYSGVSRQRPLCPYPSRQVYNGAGDPDIPESWHCDLSGPEA